MIDACEDLLNSINDGQTCNFGDEANKITFNNLLDVIFGADVNGPKTDKLPYLMNNNKSEPQTLRKFFTLISEAYIKQYFNPLAVVFPFINKYDLINPYKRDKKNRDTLMAYIKNIASKGKDPKSVQYQVFKQSSCTQQEILEDLVFYMVAGSETSGRVVTTSLYYMKKYPETLENL
jgi:cytochrome P450